MFEKFDRQIGVLTESLARKLDRREMIATSVKGLFATVTATALVQLTDLGNAFAKSCSCGANPVPCTEQGRICPATPGCPSNCVICVPTDCNGLCTTHATGQWVACSGLGKHGNGYKVCTDCTCGGCLSSQKCTCLSQCVCCHCSTSQDVKREMQRLAAVTA